MVVEGTGEASGFEAGASGTTFTAEAAPGGAEGAGEASTGFTAGATGWVEDTNEAGTGPGSATGEIGAGFTAGALATECTRAVDGTDEASTGFATGALATAVARVAEGTGGAGTGFTATASSPSNNASASLASRMCLRMLPRSLASASTLLADAATGLAGVVEDTGEGCTAWHSMQAQHH